MSQGSTDIRVALVDDRAHDLESIERLLKATPGFVCVATCESAEAAMDKLPEARPDVVLMDIQMPGTSGIECVRRLSRVLPGTQFMMLTVVEDHDMIFRSLAAGATGYLLKKAPAARLLEAIQELHAGGAPMSGQVARKVVAAFRQASPGTSPGAELSPVEQAILRLLARGLLYKEVAEEMSISVSTVRTHVWHIYGKLHVHNRTEAILKGLPRGVGC